jgi:small GTP-binding protein
MDTYDLLFKIVLTGSSGSGKSTLFKKIINPDVQMSNKYVETLGVEFGTMSKKISDRIIKFNIWDTSGRSNLRVVANSYYKPSNLVIVVLDLTSISSFSELSGNVCDAKEHIDSNSMIVVVGTKGDLIDRRKISAVAIQEFCDEHNVDYVEIVDKSIGKPVKDIFQNKNTITIESNNIVKPDESDIESINPLPKIKSKKSFGDFWSMCTKAQKEDVYDMEPIITPYILKGDSVSDFVTNTTNNNIMMYTHGEFVQYILNYVFYREQMKK